MRKLKHASIVVYGKIPKGKEKVKTYCLKRGGFWFMNKEEIKKAEKEGFKIILK